MDRPIFNLIEIFREMRRTAPPAVSVAEHCEQKHHHDYYCDAEKPYVQKS